MEFGELGTVWNECNIEYILEELEALAVAEALPTFSEFVYLLETPPVAPSKPDKIAVQNKIFENPPPVKNTKEARFFARALEDFLWKDYFLKLSKYEKEKQDYLIFSMNFSKTYQSYISFISQKSKTIFKFFFEQYKTLPLSEENRKKHTYITGGSGSGKSELVKVIIYNYLRFNTSTALVVIEPHGKLTREVAQWQELQNDRLIYIRPGMGEKTPVFNPFDISEEDRENPRIISVLVDDTIDTIGEVLGRDFTPNMETLLKCCFFVLFNTKNATFLDVLRFLDPDKNADLIRIARRVFPNGSPMLDFIENDLLSDTLRPTRQALKMRFTNIFSRYFISSFLIGKSTFNLDQAIKEKKCILFNFSSSDIGATEARIFGKLIISHIKAFGFRQGRTEEEAENLTHITPCHVFIDECQEFITPALQVILQQLRKFGIHLTLIQQAIGQGMSKELEEAILTNTAIKIIGKSSEQNYKKFSSITGANLEQLQQLDKGRGLFAIKSQGVAPLVFRTPSHLIDNTGGVSPEVWGDTLENQLARYYTTRTTHTPDQPTANKEKPTNQNLLVAEAENTINLDY